MGFEIFGIDVLFILALMGVGMCAGFINAMAFGGSMLTVPILIYLIPTIPSIPLGTEATALANGTNRVAVTLAIPGVVGASIGALIGTETPDKAFKPILAIVMVTMLLLTFFNPTEWLYKKVNPSGRQYRIITTIVLFFVGMYGGFIQIGTGLLIITALRILDGEDLVITNAHKVFIVFFYTIIALGVFLSKGQVHWVLGLTLAIGTSTGAWIGSHMAVKMGDKWIKVVLVLAVIASVTKLLWDTISDSG